MITSFKRHILTGKSQKEEGVRHDIRAAWFRRAFSAGLLCSLCCEQRRQSCRVRPAGQHRNSLSTNQDRRGRHDIRAAWFRTASSAARLWTRPRPPSLVPSPPPPPRPGKFEWGVKLVTHTQTTSGAKN